MKTAIKEAIPNNNGLRWQQTNIFQRVNREKEIKLFDEHLIKLGTENLTPILEWYGGPGIGKSTLIDLLIDNIEENYRNLKFVRLNFKSPDKTVQNPELANIFERKPNEFILALTKQLWGITNISDELVNTSQEISNYIQSKKVESAVKAIIDGDVVLQDHLEEFVQTFLNTLKDWLEKKNKVVYFFDETEFASYHLTSWIEENVIAPLILLPGVMIVWTARRQWRWRRPEIRRRLISNKLEVFEPGQVATQIEKRGAVSPSLAEQLFRDVYRITGGHPSANSIVIDEISSWKRFQELEKDQLLKKIFDNFIDLYAFGNITSTFERTTYKLLSMVRLVDTSIIKHIITQVETINHEINLKEFQEKDYKFYSTFMQDIKKGDILEWNNGFTVDRDLKYLIEEYYRVVKPIVYIKVHESALAFYKEWLEKPIDNRSKFIQEEIFHQVSLNRLVSEIDIHIEYQDPKEILNFRLTELSEKFGGDQLQWAINHLRDSILQDADLGRLLQLANQHQLQEYFSEVFTHFEKES